MARGHGMIAGDHPHPDPDRLGRSDSGLGLRAGRVDDADHGQQRQILDQFEEIIVGVELVRREVPKGGGQDPQALLAQLLVLIRVTAAQLAAECLRFQTVSYRA
jgi:hypothetical protein